MTMPPEFLAAMAIAWASSVSASFLHGDIAVRVGGGAADDPDVDRKGLVEQVLLAVDFHHPHEIGGGHRVQLAAAKARVDEGTQADAGNRSRFARGNIAKEVGDHPLRQVVGLNAIGHRQLLQLGNQAPVTADDAADQAIVAEVVESPLLAIALSGRINERQVARMAEPVGIFTLPFKKKLFQRHGNVLGEADADETAGGDGVAVLNQTHRLACGDHLSGVRGAQRGGHGMTGKWHDLSPEIIGERRSQTMPVA
jgi:hypothetical protein